MEAQYFLILMCLNQGLILCDKSAEANIEKLYMKGVEAYDKEKWSLCVNSFEEVNQLNRLKNNIVANCRISCQSDPFKPYLDESVEDLQIYEQFIKRAKCLSVCQSRGFKTLQLNPKVSKKTEVQIKSLEQYTYLHMCYYHRNDLHRAASAAYTYVLHHPSDASMTNNMQFYLEQPNLEKSSLVNFEAKNYVSLFNTAVEAYGEKKWNDCIVAAEEAFQDYIAAENECRALCESSFDQGWLLDLVTSVANHFTYVLQCKQQCENGFYELEFKTGLDFLLEILNYLQISYYRVEKFKNAGRSVASILYVKPEDEDMLVNKKFYKEYINEDEFVPLPQIVHYYKRSVYEKKILSFVEKHFTSIHSNMSAI